MIKFYVYMFCAALLMPAVMLFFGYRWQKKPPDKINIVFGYRSRRSMSSKEAWDFAHKHCGRTWVKLGWFTLAFAIVAMVILGLISLDVATVGTVGGIIVCLELFPTAAPLVMTERALKKEFGI